MRLLAVDPGLSGTGWAFFRRDYPEVCGVLSPQRKEDDELWWQAAEDLSSRLLDIAHALDARHFVIEMPMFMGSSGGLVTARSGALVKLTWFVGYLSARVRRWELDLVTPQQWKGQLSKQQVEIRIRRILKDFIPQDMKSHAVDAVGIGLYKLGRF